MEFITATATATAATAAAATATTTTTTVEFADVARTLTSEARRHELVGPSFRCPPRLVGIDRSIRRRANGAVVAVRLQGRPRGAVIADMIEGVVVTNGLLPPDADRVRTELWASLDHATSSVAA
jgi:hypothetical protein